MHGWDTLSALFGSAPGALSQVIAHATQYQSDLRGIAIVQTIRVMILTAGLPVALASLGLLPVSAPRALVFDSSVIELVVLVAGSTLVALILQWLRFPGGLIFGAMLASALMHGSGAIQATMPWWIGQCGDGGARRDQRIALCQYQPRSSAALCGRRRSARSRLRS